MDVLRAARSNPRPGQGRLPLGLPLGFPVRLPVWFPLRLP